MVLRHRHKVNQDHYNKATPSQRASDAISGFSGSWRFVALHIVWWSFWFFTRAFEGPPWGVLTMLLSLEAILLSTFVLMSQNRQGARDRAVLEHASSEVDKADQQNQEILQEIKRNTEITLAIVKHLDLLAKHVSKES